LSLKVAGLFASLAGPDLFVGGVVRPEFTADRLRRPHLEALRSTCGRAYVELDDTRLWLEAVTDAGEDADLHAGLFKEAKAWTARADKMLSALDSALSIAARTLTEDGQQTLPQQLAQLAELHDLGALSDEEFAQAKSQVLGGVAQP
jgi:hypothetical protein